ncbi:hypothetical protein CEXT_549301 [Caerostris extrusa]|uniref:Uncharacterized protein n=1 Tax=Caerostris extrusa TaxID=172846 RepID=A0AAV4VMM1_CAEEX|nr:hypothetical protein CEXT_549301 [Caerostris extrusa]
MDDTILGEMFPFVSEETADEKFFCVLQNPLEIRRLSQKMSFPITQEPFKKRLSCAGLEVGEREANENECLFKIQIC